jgi:hypothetical protein
MKRLNAAERKEQGFRSVHDIAKLCGLNRNTMDYHILMGWIPAPKEKCSVKSGRKSKRLFYNPEQVKELIKFYLNWTPYRHGKEVNDE